MVDTGTLLLNIESMSTRLWSSQGWVDVVRDVSLGVAEGEVLAIVGESGCGKSVAMMSLLGLLPLSARAQVSGQAWFQGDDLLALRESQLRGIRGSSIGMVFQDPMTSLNPTMTIGAQITETLRLHGGLGTAAARQEALRWLDRMQIPQAQERFGHYPFQFSGGMLQRVMIAIALANRPRLLIADEPTTALDVTVQREVLELILDLQRQDGMAMILVTHDVGVVAEIAHRVNVMYAGEIVESGPVDQVLGQPAHPYTRDLIAALPSAKADAGQPLLAIAGSPPPLHLKAPGCSYCPRCAQAMQVCAGRPPGLKDLAGRASRCWLQHYSIEHSVTGLYQPGWIHADRGGRTEQVLLSCWKSVAQGGRSSQFLHPPRPGCGIGWGERMR